MTCTKETIDYLFAAAPIAISAAVAYVAWAQYKTNKRKFRLDLYNRRFAVFEATLAYYKSYYSKNAETEAFRKAEAHFVLAYREASFLFGRDSPVYTALTEVKDTLAAVPEHQKQDPTEVMKSLEDALLSWLDFHKIEK